MKNFRDYEGVVCKDRTELKFLAAMAEENGYKVCPKIYKPKYNHIIFLEGWFMMLQIGLLNLKLQKKSF